MAGYVSHTGHLVTSRKGPFFTGGRFFQEAVFSKGLFFTDGPFFYRGPFFTGGPELLKVCFFCKEAGLREAGFYTGVGVTEVAELKIRGWILNIPWSVKDEPL